MDHTQKFEFSFNTKLKIKAALVLALFTVASFIPVVSNAQIKKMPVSHVVSSEKKPLIRQCQKSSDCGRRAFSLRVLADKDSVLPEIRGLIPRFLSIAVIQAEIWDDTILEGPYEADGGVFLDRVEGLYQQGELVAYRITYSSLAWHLGLNGARIHEGRIVESAYVSLSLRGFVRDESAIAEFQPNR